MYARYLNKFISSYLV